MILNQLLEPFIGFNYYCVKVITIVVIIK